MTTEPMTFETWSQTATSRSHVYGFLGALYCQLPDEQFVTSLQGDEFAGVVAALVATEGLSDGVREGAKLIARYLEVARTMPANELKTQVNVERTRLIRGVMPGYGPRPPYEAVYLSSDDEDVSAFPIASVMQAYIEAEALLPEDGRDQPDYIGLELDFMRHLCAKEAQAWAAGDREKALDFISKQRSFIDKHIKQWIPVFCDVMFDDAKLDLYRGVARMTKGFVLDEAEGIADYLDAAAACTE